MRATVFALALLVAWLFPSSSARAEAWLREGNTLRLPLAKVSIPTRAAGISLRQTGEFSRQGEGLDNAAQYASDDGAIVGTVYIYLTPYPDTALTALQTGRVILIRFGSSTSLSESGVVGSGSTNQGVIRRVYDHSGNFTTAAAFLRTGNWIVKLRVSGPEGRRAEIVTALDAMISGLKLEAAAKAEPAADLQPNQCPATTAKDAKRQKLSLSLGLKGIDADNPIMEAFLQGALNNNYDTVQNGEKQKRDTIAKNGFQSVCTRGSILIGSNEILLLQATGETKDPESIIALINDAGTLLEMRRDDVTKGYTVLLHQIGESKNFGTFDGPLSVNQLRDLLMETGKFQPVSVTRYKASGERENTILVQTR